VRNFYSATKIKLHLYKTHFGKWVVFAHGKKIGAIQ
jgi:hypothetical protein